MTLCTQFLRPTRLGLSIIRKLSVAAEAAQTLEEPLQAFRTLENDPSMHTTDHLNRIYTISPEKKNQLFFHAGIPKSFNVQIKTFNECGLLVRSPAVEIISYLNQTDYTRPPNKYVLYGKYGTGKTMTMAHLLHYAAMTKSIIVYAWPVYWYRYPKEVAMSQSKQGCIDLPIDGAAWLAQFKKQNEALLSELDLKLSKDYTWGSRETMKCGSPLIEMINFGMSRAKYSCDVIYVLTDELKLASTAGKCRTMVMIDGYNIFFNETSKIKDDAKQYVKPINVTLTEPFLNMTKYDWCNGAIVLTVDDYASSDEYVQTEGLPRRLLGKEGFEHLDPFLPVKVDDYTPDEFHSMMEYFKDRKWLRDITPDGIKEIELLTARNPYAVMEYTAPL